MKISHVAILRIAVLLPERPRRRLRQFLVFKLFLTGRFPLVSTLIYVAMGWLVLIAAAPMFKVMAPATLAWLIAGGVTYTAGTVFYHNQRIPQAHAIWHLFVLGGSVCHALAVGSAL